MTANTAALSSMGAPGARPYHLEPEQVEFFDTHGFLVLPGRIDPDLLARLQEAAEGWIARGRATGPVPNSDYHFASRSGAPALFRVDYLHAKHESASLELLGSPAILGIAESLAGPDFVPTYESMVFKGEGDGAAVPWHQDAVHPRNHRIFNVDVYLDASRSAAGALRVVPGSHRAPADICALEAAHGWQVPGSLEVEMEPGDVLVHDVMLVHGSPSVQGNSMRRTIYYEFRAATQILSEGPWDERWVASRQRLIPIALAERIRNAPAEESFQWSLGSPQPSGEEAVSEALRVAHLVHSPGAYCSAGSVAEN
ncbi:phytanoyl-CoA dioxygenase family protein [Streptomyces sp. 142MFCol3.1]|uniref:phytanoyl-CoA dioxygenase family protein n=1 Tax=Streptomyces sp. 142MFCol3.1 TaxID=1172179 RepID=UPI000687B5B7|nr:phytanoyl-CoA dioxygenase family protein [Streptomyces sp. 142MFCol3.1]